MLAVYDPYSMTGAELRTLRQRLQWTQARLAEALGVAPNTVARWERGELGISEPVARLIGLIAAQHPPAKKPTRRS
jgi:transcriptional regulator with XRE-family HTH domain